MQVEMMIRIKKKKQINLSLKIRLILKQFLIMNLKKVLLCFLNQKIKNLLKIKRILRMGYFLLFLKKLESFFLSFFFYLMIFFLDYFLFHYLNHNHCFHFLHYFRLQNLINFQKDLVVLYLLFYFEKVLLEIYLNFP